MKTLIVSDIHANLQALKAALEKDGDYDKLIFLGDVVDYEPNPKECLNFIKENADYYVRGNHDIAVGYNVDCNCMNTFRDYSISTRQWHKTLLAEDDKNFLRNMPVFNKAHIEDNSFLLAFASQKGGLLNTSMKKTLTKKLKIYSQNLFCSIILISNIKNRLTI